MKEWTKIALLTGIVVLINLLSNQYFFRIDATQDNQYTLSKATKNILSDLSEPVTVTAYFTRDLPQQYLKNYSDIRDLLLEYSVRSDGMVNFEFIDPADDPEIEQQAVSSGISPLLINVREKDEVAQKKAFMGALVSTGDQQDVIGYIPPGGALEYILTTSIKKVSSLEKPFIGIIQGYGCPNFQELGLVIQAMSVQYNVEGVSLNPDANIDSKYETVVLIRPTDSIPQEALDQLRTFRAAGGNLTLALNAVEGDFQSVSGRVASTGAERLAADLGARINSDFVVDASSGSITVQQRQGFFTVNSNVEFPYFPLVRRFEEHPITKGLEQVVFQFVSSIEPSGDTTAVFTPLVRSSDNSGIQRPPVYFDIERRWTANDFNLPDRTLAAGIDYPNGGDVVVFADGDFPLGAQGRGQTPDNVSLFVNAVDFLSDDTGLIDLRTKGIATRPITDLEDAQQSRIKWVTFLLPILLVVAYGLFRSQRNRRRKINRMMTQY